MRPINVESLKTLRRTMKGDEVVFLHSLLNHHLGPPDDQLPVQGSGADDFGPRTEAKVKRFQEVNRIDVGTRLFKDGVVGPHTWKVLTDTQQVKITVLAAPSLKLTPPTFPSFPGSFPPRSQTAIPVPKLTLDNLQIQAGEQGHVPILRQGDGRSFAANCRCPPQ